MLARVLLAVDKPALQKRLHNCIWDPDIVLESVRGRRGLWKRLSHESADLIVISRSLIPKPISDTIRLLRDLPDSPNVVVLSEREDPEERVRLLSAGCDAVLNSDLPGEQQSEVIKALLEKRQDLATKELLIGHPLTQPRLSDFVSHSPAMQSFMDVVQRIRLSDVSLFILGETGVGKERLARAIHAEGLRARGPFIAINCGALPEGLLESELFGHEEGAFTGATRTRRGLFELAHRGTVFLDEIGELPYHLQVKLLRAVQDREIQRVGSEKIMHIDVRVMAATNRDLETEVAEKRFRKDLFYRLSVVSLTIPPLRERKEDIPVLAESYLGYFRSRIGCDVRSIHPEALDALTHYAWPGNVRELMNIVERAMLLCGESEILPEDLPQAIGLQNPLTGISEKTGSFFDAAGTLPDEWLEKPFREVRKDVVAKLERRYLEAQLQRTGGRIGETARIAGMEPRSLHEKMKRHGLRKEDFRAQQI